MSRSEDSHRRRWWHHPSWLSRLLLLTGIVTDARPAPYGLRRLGGADGRDRCCGCGRAGRCRGLSRRALGGCALDTVLFATVDGGGFDSAALWSVFFRAFDAIAIAAAAMSTGSWSSSIDSTTLR